MVVVVVVVVVVVAVAVVVVGESRFPARMPASSKMSARVTPPRLLILASAPSP